MCTGMCIPEHVACKRWMQGRSLGLPKSASMRGVGEGERNYRDPQPCPVYRDAISLVGQDIISLVAHIIFSGPSEADGIRPSEPGSTCGTRHAQ